LPGVGEAEVRLAGPARPPGSLHANHRQSYRLRGYASWKPGRVSDADSLRHELSEGLPVPREPAYAAKRSHDGEAPAAFE